MIYWRNMINFWPTRLSDELLDEKVHQLLFECRPKIAVAVSVIMGIVAISFAWSFSMDGDRTQLSPMILFLLLSNSGFNSGYRIALFKEYFRRRGMTHAIPNAR